MKKKQGKLTLSKETLHSLEQERLQLAIGAHSADGGCFSCYPCRKSDDTACLEVCGLPPPK